MGELPVDPRRLRKGGALVLQIALAAALLGIAAAYVTRGAADPWDFRTYYYAALAAGAGIDPYSPPALSAVAGRAITLPYLYPPVTLFLFLPFTHLSFGAASALWLGIKCVLAGLLLLIWWKDFLRPMAPELLLAVAVLGFDAALLWDLRTGNAALLEETCLWLGLAAFLRGRRGIAAVWIALASVFKLYPILFLALLAPPAPWPRRRWVPVAVGLGLLACLLAFPVGHSRAWIRTLFAAAVQDRPPAGVNPTALGVIDGILAAAGVSGAPAVWIGPGVFLVYLAALLAWSAPALRRITPSAPPVDRVTTAVLLWFLLSPRMMVYAYASAVPAALLVLHRAFRSPFQRAVGVALLTGQGIARFLPGKPPALLGAASFFLVLAAWVLWMRCVPTGDPAKGAA